MPTFENSPQTIAALIDHTKLAFADGDVPQAEIQKLCEEAQAYGFYAVCVRPEFVRQTKQCLQQSSVKVATVIGFPQSPVSLEAEQQHPTIGDVPLNEKLAEVRHSLADGADELDLVLNVRQFKAEFQADIDTNTVHELQAVQQAAQGRPVKVILETDLLSPVEIAAATRCCVKAQIALDQAIMIKTSTGFVQGGQGATVENIQLIRHILQELKAPLGIKASGGVRSAESALAMVQAGATRIGTSAGVNIVQALAAYPKEVFAEPTALG